MPRSASRTLCALLTAIGARTVDVQEAMISTLLASTWLLLVLWTSVGIISDSLIHQQRAMQPFGGAQTVDSLMLHCGAQAWPHRWQIDALAVDERQLRRARRRM